MRIFIGFQFNEETKDYLEQVQKKVKQASIEGNYTLKDNFHLTLRFLGELTEQNILKLKESLKAISKEEKPFNITIGNTNSFNRGNKHIVYVEVINGKDHLLNLTQSLDHILDEHFGKRDNQFKPHITLGREIILNKNINNMEPYQKPITIDSISIMLSTRIENVLTYSPIYTVTLERS